MQTIAYSEPIKHQRPSHKLVGSEDKNPLPTKYVSAQDLVGLTLLLESDMEL